MCKTFCPVVSTEIVHGNISLFDMIPKSAFLRLHLFLEQEILLSEDLRSIRLSFMIKEAYRRSHECYFARIFYSH